MQSFGAGLILMFNSLQLSAENMNPYAIQMLLPLGCLSVTIKTEHFETKEADSLLSVFINRHFEAQYTIKKLTEIVH